MRSMRRAGVEIGIWLLTAILISIVLASTTVAADEPRVEVLIFPSEDQVGFLSVRVRIAFLEGVPAANGMGISMIVRVSGVAREAIPIDDGLYEVTITLRSQQVGDIIVEVDINGRVEKTISLTIQGPRGKEPSPDPNHTPSKWSDPALSRGSGLDHQTRAWEAIAFFSLLVGIISATAVALVALGILS
jgi:hypothetical protein